MLFVRFERGLAKGSKLVKLKEISCTPGLSGNHVKILKDVFAKLCKSERKST
jgi:hypothetical protein